MHMHTVNPSPRLELATPVAEIIPPHIALADELGLTGFAAVLRAEDAFPEVMDEATEKAFVKRMGEIHETTEAQTGPLALLDKMLVKWLFGPDTDTGPFTLKTLNELIPLLLTAAGKLNPGDAAPVFTGYRLQRG